MAIIAKLVALVAGVGLSLILIYVMRYDQYQLWAISWSNFYTKGDTMGIFSWIILGGIAGWLASLITGKNPRQGIISNIVVGVIGGLLGGGLMETLGGTGLTGFNLYSLLVALGGAVLALWLYNIIRR